MAPAVRTIPKRRLSVAAISSSSCVPSRESTIASSGSVHRLHWGIDRTFRIA